MDSGSDGNFMDSSLARTLGLDSIPLPKRLKATSLDGSPLWEVSHQTTPLTMSFGKNHDEEILFSNSVLLVNLSEIQHGSREGVCSQGVADTILSETATMVFGIRQCL